MLIEDRQIIINCNGYSIPLTERWAKIIPVNKQKLDELYKKQYGIHTNHTR